MEPMDEDFYSPFMMAQDTPKKRKRGGLAGIYDRNKKIIKPVVSGALGLINPALGAAAGAAMGGLDREGKRGVGLDLGGAVRGGIAGYGAGAAASALKGGVQGAMGATGLDRISAFGSGAKAGGQEYLNKPLLGRGAQEAAPLAGGSSTAATPLSTMTGTPAADLSSMGRNAAFETGAGAAAPAGSGMQFGATPAPDFRSRIADIGQAVERGGQQTQRGRGRGLMQGLSRVGQFVDKNATATGMGLQALSSILGSQSERRLREREQAEERRRAQNLAMLVAPMYRNNMRDMQGGR